MLGSVRQQWERVVQSSPLLKRMGKFLAVGGLGTLLNPGILVVLYHQLHLTLVVASALATELTIGHNYLWNDSWTFGRKGLSLNRFVRFNIVSLGGQCITVATLWLLAQRAGIHYVVANLLGIGLAVVWNFAINVRWTWGPT